MIPLLVPQLMALAALASEAAHPSPPPTPVSHTLLPAEVTPEGEGLAAGYAGFAPQAPGFGDAADYTNLRASFEIGRRTYSSGWGSLDDNSVIGFTFAQEPPGYIVGWDAGIFWGGASGNTGGLELRTNTWELYGGIMKTLYLMPHRVNLELGAGAALNYLLASNSSASVSDQDDWYVTGYGRAGLNLRVGGNSWVGLGARAAGGGSASVFGTDLDAEYVQATFTLSASW